MKRSTFPFAPTHSGVYAAPAAAAIAELKKSALAAGIAWFELDLNAVRDKPALLALCSKVFAMPPTFGHNWDALADSLEDFSWQPLPQGYVVLLRNGGAFTRSSPSDFAMALEILTAAATYWATKRKIFLVLLDDDTAGAREVKALPR